MTISEDTPFALEPAASRAGREGAAAAAVPRGG